MINLFSFSIVVVGSWSKLPNRSSNPENFLLIMSNLIVLVSKGGYKISLFGRIMVLGLGLVWDSLASSDASNCLRAVLLSPIYSSVFLSFLTFCYPLQATAPIIQMLLKVKYEIKYEFKQMAQKVKIGYYF